jgi:hypothetical protein
VAPAVVDVRPVPLSSTPTPERSFHDASRPGTTVSEKLVNVTTQQQALAGTTPWTQHVVTLTVPSDVVVATVSSWMLGEGTLWVDSAALDVVPSAPSFAAPQTISAAVNLDFEQ